MRPHHELSLMNPRPEAARSLAAAAADVEIQLPGTDRTATTEVENTVMDANRSDQKRSRTIGSTDVSAG